MTDRGTLRSVILAETGQDIRKCAACQRCYVNDSLQAQFDLPLTEIVTAARRNDEAALLNRTIWVVAKAQPETVRCSKGLDLVAVAGVLCEEARLRGFADDED
jgi:heterodisulfide reductase subunit C